MFVAARLQPEDRAPALHIVRADESSIAELDQFRSVFEDSPIAMSVASLEFRLLRVNQAHCDLLGYTEYELLTTDFRIRIHPDDLSVNDDLRADLFAGRIRSYSTERRYFHHAGHIVWCIVTVSLIRDDSGQPRYFVGQMHDITERKQAEEALRASERRMNQVLASSLDGILIFDRDGRVVNASAAVERITGHAVSGLLGRWWNPFPWDMRDGTDADFAPGLHPIGRVLGERCTLSGIEARFHRPDDAVVDVMIDVAPLWGVNGDFDGVVATLHDVSERKLMERKLERFALHDALTGLPNRRLFTERATQAHAAFVESGTAFGLLFVDLNDFKPVNDRLGHAAGDFVLAETARRLRCSVPDGATVARMGGDEFAVLLPKVATREDLDEIERGILRDVQGPYPVAGTSLHLTASVGGSLSTSDDLHLSDLLRRADDAMYRFKHRQRLALEQEKSRSNPYWRSFQLT